MATYIKSVSNSVEQGKDFPVITLEDLGIISQISIRARRQTKWYNKDIGKNFTTQVIDVNYRYNDGLTNDDIYKAWNEKLIPMNSTYGYGGNNRYGVRFNVGNGYYLCSDCFSANVNGGITKTNDIWKDPYIREWDIYSVNYSQNMGFPVVDGSKFFVNGGWLLYYDEQNNKNNYLFVTTKSTLDGNSKGFPGQGGSYFTLICFDDIPNFTFQDVIEKSEEFGYYSESGGYGGGSFDDSSDAFGLPSLPSLGVSEVGFINVYNPSKGQLQGFADELFPNFEMPTPSTATGIEAVAENLANTFEVLGDFAESYVNAGLINYVIDCHIVPVAPTTSGTAKIKVGFKTFNYTPAKVTSDYVEFDCGTLEIAEYYQNFLDYEGTKAKLYLPFIGFVDIKPEWFQSGKLGVTYHFNIIDGSCIAFVIATSSKSNLKNTVVATFGGNCCVHMPITGVNYSSMISGVVGGAVGIASNASNMIKTNRADKGTVMSNIEGATGIASNLAEAVGAKPSIEQSNGYNAGMSFMCYRRPYLLIERPVASFSKNYPKEQGLPLNVTKKLGSMKGFTTCTAPVVDNFHCLEEEKEMIKQALIEGTIF